VIGSISAQVVRTPRGRLAISYAITGDLGRIRIPALRRPHTAERLWQHTCCEIFIGRKGSTAYHEFNFSPSRAWAAYAFRCYRKGEALRTPDPAISVRKTARTLELDAVITVAAGRLAIGLSAVIEEHDGRLSYWALRHPPGKPDFHHSEAFALELE
jgi:hypothetical protein